MPPRPTKLSKLAKLAVAALEDLKGQNIQVLDVRKLTAMTDTLVVCSGTSSRHAKSLAESVIKAAKDAGEVPRGVQGLEQGEWVLVDLIEVVVHVMQVQTRAHYQLEKLWDLPVDEVPVAKPKSKPKAKAKTKTKTKPKSAPRSKARVNSKANPVRNKKAAAARKKTPAARRK